MKRSALRLLTTTLLLLLVGILAAAPVMAGTGHIYRTLYYGDSGHDVELLQNKLRELGYLTGARNPVYYDKTQRAVRLFETAHGYTPTDYCTKKMQKLIANASVDPEAYRTLHYGDYGDDVKQIQRKLKKLGYFDGTIGGNYLDLTTEAVREFQRAHSLAVRSYCTVSVQKAILKATY